MWPSSHTQGINSTLDSLWIIPLFNFFDPLQQCSHPMFPSNSTTTFLYSGPPPTPLPIVGLWTTQTQVLSTSNSFFGIISIFPLLQQVLTFVGGWLGTFDKDTGCCMFVFACASYTTKTLITVAIILFLWRRQHHSLVFETTIITFGW